MFWNICNTARSYSISVARASKFMKIEKLPKLDVLTALYKNAKNLDNTFFGYPAFPQENDIKRLLEKTGQTEYFGRFAGRGLFVDLSGTYLDPTLYDYYNGSGAAEKALASLCEKHKQEHEKRETFSAKRISPEELCTEPVFTLGSN